MKKIDNFFKSPTVILVIAIAVNVFLVWVISHAGKKPTVEQNK